MLLPERLNGLPRGRFPEKAHNFYKRGIYSFSKKTFAESYVFTDFQKHRKLVYWTTKWPLVVKKVRKLAYRLHQQIKIRVSFLVMKAVMKAQAAQAHVSWKD